MTKNLDKIIGERIRLRREQLGMTQDQLAQRAGYKSRTSINKIEAGVQSLTQPKIKPVADALMTTPDYIMSWDDETMPEPLPAGVKPLETRAVPMIGDVACGEPIVANQDFQSYVEIGADIKCDCCLRARGDSMKNVRIHDGDIVFIRRQPMVENGDIAAVIINDEVTLKRFYYYRETNLIILKPENPEYEDIIYSGADLEQIKVFGKAVAFQSDIK